MKKKIKLSGPLCLRCGRVGKHKPITHYKTIAGCSKSQGHKGRHDFTVWPTDDPVQALRIHGKFP